MIRSTLINLGTLMAIIATPSYAFDVTVEVANHDVNRNLIHDLSILAHDGRDSITKKVKPINPGSKNFISLTFAQAVKWDIHLHYFEGRSLKQTACGTNKESHIFHTGPSIQNIKVVIETKGSTPNCRVLLPPPLKHQGDHHHHKKST